MDAIVEEQWRAEGSPGCCEEGGPQDETSVSSEEFDMNDSTWMSADQQLQASLSPPQEETMRSAQNIHSQEDGE
ncbi:hypothetical protein E2320_009346 [Naja naja]|nr:hypothetical protein E2320_009346 [Naja naja]